MTGVLFLSFSISAQNSSEPRIEGADTIKNYKLVIEKEVGKAFKYSMVLPGLGQFEQKKYWKIPIIYTGGIYFASQAISNHNNYKQNLDLARQSLIAPPLVLDAMKISEDYLYYRDKYQSFKKDRNTALMGLAGIYALNMLDAAYSVETDYHSPKKALIYSTFIPGLGQAYNKKYWKIPVIYTLGYFAVKWIRTYDKNYDRFKQAYADILDYENGIYYNPNPGQPPSFYKVRQLTEADFEAYGLEYWKDNYRKSKDWYRRNRDYTTIMLGFLYILNMVDASVDAYLFDYNVSEDLSYEFNPVILPSTNSYVPGVSLMVSF